MEEDYIASITKDNENLDHETINDFISLISELTLEKYIKKGILPTLSRFTADSLYNYFFNHQYVKWKRMCENSVSNGYFQCSFYSFFLYKENGYNKIYKIILDINYKAEDDAWAGFFSEGFSYVKVSNKQMKNIIQYLPKKDIGSFKNHVERFDLIDKSELLVRKLDDIIIRKGVKAKKSFLEFFNKYLSVPGLQSAIEWKKRDIHALDGMKTGLNKKEKIVEVNQFDITTRHSQNIIIYHFITINMRKELNPIITCRIVIVYDNYIFGFVKKNKFLYDKEGYYDFDFVKEY